MNKRKNFYFFKKESCYYLLLKITCQCSKKTFYVFYNVGNGVMQIPVCNGVSQ